MGLPKPGRFIRPLLLCLALDWGGSAIAPLAATTGGVLMAPLPAAAQVSGGYSRPRSALPSSGFGGAVRRPSIGGSGGYQRPSGGGSGSFGGGSISGGDRAIQRRAAGQALQDYRASQAPPETSRRPSAGWDGGTWSPPPSPRRPEPSNWSGGGWGGSGWSAGRRFGPWDAVLAWSLLNSLTRPGTAAYFAQNRDSAGYQKWRREAEEKAHRDPAVAQKLAELDAVMAKAEAQPAAPEPESSGAGVIWIVVIAGGAILVGLWVARRKLTPGAGMPVTGGGQTIIPAGLGGSEASRFRVGMTFPLDPSPFLLAAGATKVKPPPETGGMVSIEAIGLIADGPVQLHRLYLPGREAFLMLHLGPDGSPDECRYFSLLDQIAPASREDWSFWLDPAQGMIGWPQFQTKDGKLYDRIWAAGNARVPPRQQQETVQDVAGVTQRHLQTMLYGARTGAPPPAPDTEYILVCAVEQNNEAWVEVHAGIDINPAALVLPAVPLSN